MYPPLFFYFNRTCPVVTETFSLYIIFASSRRVDRPVIHITCIVLPPLNFFQTLVSQGGGDVAVIGIVHCILCGLP